MLMCVCSGYVKKDQCSERVGARESHKTFRYIRGYINNLVIKALKEKKGRKRIRNI